MQWDVFCRVIDNWGDIGVCWRLCADLATRGHAVRLWVDDPTPLDWMAPSARAGRWPGIEVLSWPEDGAGPANLRPSEVWVEAFGCEPPDTWVEARRHAIEAHAQPAPVWINLEYLSAEAWVERCHRLPSPIGHGPGKGMVRWFFYPGFRDGTGGLLREADLLPRLAEFDRAAWRADRGLPPNSAIASLFSYEPPALPALLTQIGPGQVFEALLVTPGRSDEAVGRALRQTEAPERLRAACRPLKPVPQSHFDEMLWASDLNFVRGEDSLIRGLWAGEALIWQIYPQHDDAHHAKLEAFLDWLDAPDSLRLAHRIWNGLQNGPLVLAEWPAWRDCVRNARDRLLRQPDLLSQLLKFVTEKR